MSPPMNAQGQTCNRITSLAGNPQSGVTPMLEREKTSQRLLQGTASLHLSIPPLIAAKVTANYDGMAPMERFKSETLGGIVTPAGAGDAYLGGVCEAVACFSCRATIGGVSEKGESKDATQSS